MSDQARIETAIDTTIDNCEALRARLAKYEDADGKPITTIAEQAREISSLRNIISESAAACGAAVSVECSEEFMAMLPDEIRTVMAGKSREVERLSKCKRFESQYHEAERELAALKAQSSGVVLPPRMVCEDGYPSDDWLETNAHNRCLDEVACLNPAPSHGGQVRDVLPGGWTAKPTDDREGFIISSPRINGVASHFAVFPDSNDFASCALWRMLSTSPSAGSQKEQGE